MKFTLKHREKEVPFYLNKNNELTLEKTSRLIDESSITYLAELLVDKKIIVPPHFVNELVIADSFIYSFFDDIAVSRCQSFLTKVKLVNVDDYKNFGFIAQRKQVPMYLETVKIDFNSPEVEKLQILKLEKKFSENLKIGDRLIQCSDNFSSIYFNSKTYRVVDSVDTDLLFENHDIDRDKHGFFAVMEE